MIITIDYRNTFEMNINENDYPLVCHPENVHDDNWEQYNVECEKLAREIEQICGPDTPPLGAWDEDGEEIYTW